MRRLPASLAVSAAHLVLTVAAFQLTIHEIGRRFSHGPSAWGWALEAILGVLGLPLVTPLLHAEVFPLFGPAWRTYALLAANSLLCGAALALLPRRAAGDGGTP